MKELRAAFKYAKVRTRKLPTFVRDSIFQNCVFQLSATMEDYLGELTSRWFSNLAGTANNSKLPLMTRSLFVAKSQEKAFTRFVGLGDEDDLATRTSQHVEAFELFNENLIVRPLDFKAALVKDRKFPSVRNVPVLFRRLGIPKMFKLLSKRTKSNVELAWQAFMDVRNALAHENPPSITDQDVARYFGQVERWIGAIDREFYGHVVRSSGTQYWT